MLGRLELIAEREPHRCERAALRWHAGLELERPGLTIAEAQLALAAVRALPADPEQAGAATSEVFVESLNAPALADLVEELRCASVGEAVREGHEQNRRDEVHLPLGQRQEDRVLGIVASRLQEARRFDAGRRPHLSLLIHDSLIDKRGEEDEPQSTATSCREPTGADEPLRD